MNKKELNKAAQVFYDTCEEYSKKEKCGEYFNGCPVKEILGICEVGRNPFSWNIKGRTV